MSNETNAKKPHPVRARVLMALASILLVAAIALSIAGPIFANTLDSYFTRRTIHTTPEQTQSIHEAANELAAQIEGEGAVLLRNENVSVK